MVPNMVVGVGSFDKREKKGKKDQIEGKSISKFKGLSPKKRIYFAKDYKFDSPK